MSTYTTLVILEIRLLGDRNSVPIIFRGVMGLPFNPISMTAGEVIKLDIGTGLRINFQNAIKLSEGDPSYLMHTESLEWTKKDQGKIMAIVLGDARFKKI